MKLRFKLATEPAVKATIALVACITISYTDTHTTIYVGLAGASIIRVIAVVIGTYKTPPLCQPKCTN
jgi:hypothetical protein